MFKQLTQKLSETVQKMRGYTRLTEDNIKEAIRELRIALLEADVALPVIKAFISKVQSEAVGQTIDPTLSPGQGLIKLVHENLIETLGSEQASLNFKAPAPIVILMVGLQGSGKTTTTIKLAHFLKEREDKKVMVASADVYRPAAMEQLAQLAEQADVTHFASTPQDKPLAIGTKCFGCCT